MTGAEIVAWWSNMAVKEIKKNAEFSKRAKKDKNGGNGPSSTSMIHEKKLCSINVERYNTICEK